MGAYVWYSLDDETVSIQAGCYTLEQLSKIENELHNARMAIWRHIIAENAAKAVDG